MQSCPVTEAEAKEFLRWMGELEYETLVMLKVSNCEHKACGE